MWFQAFYKGMNKLEKVGRRFQAKSQLIVTKWQQMALKQKKPKPNKIIQKAQLFGAFVNGTAAQAALGNPNSTALTTPLSTIINFQISDTKSSKKD